MVETAMKLRTINDCRVVQKVFHNKRWYVDLMPSLNGRDRIPYAHYVWLETNPSFIDIPRGYVIHHLDCDETNDDATNLVLMSKPIHTAYHWKHKTQKVKIQFAYDDIHTENIYCPTKEPNIIHEKKRGGSERYYLSFYEMVNGKAISRKVYTFLTNSGKILSGFKSRKDAEFVKHEIWGKHQWNERGTILKN
jgi:HNH endonuclease